MNEIKDNALVAIDDGPTFPAYVLQGARWNGWALPYFTKDVAQQVMDWTNKLAGEDPEAWAAARWDDDNIVLSYADDPEYSRIEPNEHGRYGIGARAWCWSEKPYTPEKLDQLVARVQQEINEDINGGVVPSTVQSFSELHDYVDANTYGGLCDDDSDAPTELIIDMQERVDRWLSAQRPSEATTDPNILHLILVGMVDNAKEFRPNLTLTERVFVETFGALNEHLCHGGPLPDLWKPDTYNARATV